MLGPRQLILHIGCHKTGTTSIQHALMRERASLGKQGFTLFAQNPEGTPRTSGNALNWVQFRLSPKYRIKGVIHPRFGQALEAAGHNVIVSAETLSWVFEESEIRKLKSNLERSFDDVKVICYVRRQDAQAISHYQQASKPRGFVAARYYGNSFRALPEYREHLHYYLNYYQRLSLWADVFGEEYIDVGVMEADRLKGGDIVVDFFARLGLTTKKKFERKNLSSGAQSTKVGHLISAAGLSGKARQQLTRHLDDSGKLLPGRSSAMKFLSHFSASNDLLNERFLLHSPEPAFSGDFSMYPEAGNDVWTDSSANDAILNLLRGAKELDVFSTKEITLLESAAQRLKSIDSKLSTELDFLLERYRSQENSRDSLRERAKNRLKAYLRNLGT